MKTRVVLFAACLPICFLLPGAALVFAQEDEGLKTKREQEFSALCENLDEAHLEDLESSMPGHELLEKIRGDWEIVTATIKGTEHTAFSIGKFEIKDFVYRYKYSDDYGTDIPADFRQAAMASYQGFGYHTEFEAIEFRKAIYRASDDWKPYLRRNFVFLKGDELFVVTASPTNAQPDSLEPTDSNTVFRCRRIK